MDVASSRFLSGGSGSLVPAGLIRLPLVVILYLSFGAVRDCPSHFGLTASRFYHPRWLAGVGAVSILDPLRGIALVSSTWPEVLLSPRVAALVSGPPSTDNGWLRPLVGSIPVGGRIVR